MSELFFFFFLPLFLFVVQHWCYFTFIFRDSRHIFWLSEILVSEILYKMRGWILVGFIWSYHLNWQMNWLEFGIDPNRVKVTARSNVWENITFLNCLSYRDVTYTFIFRNTMPVLWPFLPSFCPFICTVCLSEVLKNGMWSLSG